MPGHHIDRISEDIRREIIDIMRDLKDPRIKGLLTIVRVEVTNDLSLCKVYVSAMEGLDTAKQAVQGLSSAAGFIRRELSHRLHLRKAPELRFVADNSIAHGMDITNMMKNL